MKKPQPIKNYIPVVDKLQIQVKRKFIENTELNNFFDNHTNVNLFTVNKRNAKDIYSSEGYRLEQDFKCNNNLFHLQYSAYYKNQKIGELYLSHTKAYRVNDEILPFHLDNKILYTDFIPLLTGFLDAFDFELNNYTQVDIALDTNEMAMENFLYYFDNDSKYHFTQGNKLTSDIETYGKRYRGGKRDESFYIGSNKSDKRTVLYNKSLEIIKSNKQYITEYHLLNGLDTSKEVFRIETQINGKLFTNTKSVYVTDDAEILSKYKYTDCFLKNNNEGEKASKLSEKAPYPIDYKRFNEPQYLINIFLDFHGIKFKKKDATRITNCSDITFIDFNKYNKAHTMKIKGIIEESKNNDFRNEKKMLKDCVIRFKESSQYHHLEYAAFLATSNNLTAILNLLLDEYNTDYTIERNSLRRITEEITLENHLHLRY